jgi:hypothetical protein
MKDTQVVAPRDPMLAGMSEINALLMWRRFKPGEEMCDGIFFRRKMSYHVLHHHERMAEKEGILIISRYRRLGIPCDPEPYMVKNPFGGRNRL